jgi:hypothetical protein
MFLRIEDHLFSHTKKKKIAGDTLCAVLCGATVSFFSPAAPAAPKITTHIHREREREIEPQREEPLSSPRHILLLLLINNGGR